MSEIIDLNEMSLEEIKESMSDEKREQIEKEAHEAWLKTGLSHNDVFTSFTKNTKVCKKLLELLLYSYEIKISDLKVVEIEKTTKAKQGKKEVRFDVFARDSKSIFDIEMQVQIQLMPPERIRVYQAAIDIEQMKDGESYENLKNTYIIVICVGDPFKCGEPVYRVKKTVESIDIPEFAEGEFDLSEFADVDFSNEKIPRVKEKKVKKRTIVQLGDEYIDGANIIFFNAAAYEKVKNKQLKSFLAYVAGKPINNCDFFHVINQRFDKIKKDKETEKSHMTTYFREYDIKQLAIEEGMEIGREEGREEERKKAQVIIQKAQAEIKKAQAEMEKAQAEMEKSQTEMEKSQTEMEKSQTETILRMLKKITSTEEIHELTGFSIDKIEDVRREYSI